MAAREVSDINERQRVSVKAIQTVYAGVHFRSRLEARFAAGFDRLGVLWEYEPEAFHVEGVGGYLPDFRIAGKWVEVKPTSEPGKLPYFAEQIDEPCYLLYPAGGDDRFSSHVMGVRGPGFLSSAVWAPCPRCGAVQPWIIGDEYPNSCCHTGYESHMWWDTYWGPDSRAAYPHGVRLPQYRDGVMVFGKATR